MIQRGIILRALDLGLSWISTYDSMLCWRHLIAVVVCKEFGGGWASWQVLDFEPFNHSLIMNSVSSALWITTTCVQKRRERESQNHSTIPVWEGNSPTSDLISSNEYNFDLWALLSCHLWVNTPTKVRKPARVEKSACLKLPPKCHEWSRPPEHCRPNHNQPSIHPQRIHRLHHQYLLLFSSRERATEFKDEHAEQMH
jgi:hypothetical protein